MTQLPDKPAILVTGGSRGIGAAVARLAASRGYPVCIVFRSRVEEAQRLADDIRSNGGTATFVQADISREVDVQAAFAHGLHHFGRIAGLVNSAGITGGASLVASVTEAALAEVSAVNITGSLLCVRAAVHCMATDRGHLGGAIVNLSSRASVMGAGGVWVHYAATKGAVDSMTIGLARELAPCGIRVNAVRPGIIDTDIHTQRPPGALEAMLKSIPMGRAGRPDEVAAAVMWLLSDEASYVTGAILDVAGGA